MTNKIAPKDKKIIALVGIMGSGKTTVGKKLAQKLGINFVDSDKEIEKKSKKTINKIFQESGEEYFRKIEKEMISDIVKENHPAILSLGGGAFINEDVRNLIKQECVSIWLNVNVEVILKRIGNKKNRPLLNNVDKKEVLDKLIKERSPFYAQCDIEIKEDFNNHSQASNEIIKKLQEII